ncbi:MAG: hypothetical protein QNJ14_04460 [Woeseiaceae bacterium]|nr:hypothetical protein [Woeseiaceae bacterium]
MMRLRLYMLTVLLGAAAAQAEPPPLRNNPFSRPPTMFVPEQPAGTEDLGGAPLLLIATMVGPNQAIANVEGRVLKPGDEIRGYVLQRVLEDHAIFARNGKDIVVYVKPQLEEDHDRPTRAGRRP